MHQKLTLPPTVRTSGVTWTAAVVLVLAALLLGGATREGYLAHAVVRLIGLAVLLLAAWRSPPLWTAAGRWPLLLMAGAFAVPLMQLIPLPPALWTALPGRGLFAAALEAAGMAPSWAPISLAPDATWNAALSLIPPAAALVATLGMDTAQRRALIPFILAVAAIAVVLGVGQVAEGPESGMRLYDVTNVSAAVGFFANRNHHASFLVAIVPLAAVWALSWAQRGGRWLLTVVGGGLALTFATGVGVSESRAGVVLLAIAGVGCLLMMLRARGFTPSRRTILVLAGVCVLGLLPALAFGLGEIIRELPKSAEADPRLLALPAIFKTAIANLPFGIGLGAFETFYRMLETPQTLTNAFLNHAHNDYLELFLETGLAGMLMVALFLVWFVRAALHAWRGAPGSQTAGLARAASLSILLLLAHSLVDYPLRTPALAVLLAFLCGCLVPRSGRSSQPAALGEGPAEAEAPRVKVRRAGSRRPSAGVRTRAGDCPAPTAALEERVMSKARAR